MKMTDSDNSQLSILSSPLIPPGYKQTEVGVIPEEWESLNLEAVCSMKSGESITESFIDEHSVYPCYGGNGLRGYTKRFTHDGDFALIGRQGALCGNVVGVTGKFFASEHAIVVTPKEWIEISFLTYVLSEMNLNRFSESSAQPGLSVSKILKISIAVPKNKAEQSAIATALSDVDALIESLDKLIAKKRNIKQAAMQKLLTGKARLPGFDGNWEVKKLGELGIFLKGSGVKKEDAISGHLPCIRYGEIYTHHNDVIRNFFSWISPKVASNAVKLRKGDLLFAGSGETKEEIGKCVAFIDDYETYAGGDVVILRTTGVDPIFMGYYCNHTPINAQKASKGQGDAIVHISAAALSSILVLLPPQPEQTAIAAILSDMDTEIAALETRRAKTLDLKQGMMQELLTGKTRLVKPEVSHVNHPPL
jgi:type I restriction enzyme S subunit